MWANRSADFVHLLGDDLSIICTNLSDWFGMVWNHNLV